MSVRGVRNVDDFCVFYTLQDAIPFSEEAADLICACLNWYIRKSGNSADACEKRVEKIRLLKRLEN